RGSKWRPGCRLERPGRAGRAPGAGDGGEGGERPRARREAGRAPGPDLVGEEGDPGGIAHRGDEAGDPRTTDHLDASGDEPARQGVRVPIEIEGGVAAAVGELKGTARGHGHASHHGPDVEEVEERVVDVSEGREV